MNIVSLHLYKHRRVYRHHHEITLIIKTCEIVGTHENNSRSLEFGHYLIQNHYLALVMRDLEQTNPRRKTNFELIKCSFFSDATER